MRTRDEIRDELVANYHGEPTDRQNGYTLDAILEVALDIRDLLAEKQAGGEEQKE